MEITRSSTGMTLFFAGFLFVLGSIPAVHPLPEPRTNDLDFIRTSCNVTLYPDVCFTSLAAYASAVQANPARLARLAVGVSLSQAKSTAAYIAKISRDAEYGAPDHRTTAALHDCSSNFGKAIDEMRSSLRQLRHMNGPAPAGSTFRFQMGNVQTWMSAALTDEDTCTDGFQEVVDGKTKTVVSEKVADVRKFTSNALALLNGYANNGSAP